VTPKGITLRVLLASIALSALLGIVAIIGGEFGETGVKCLLTAIVIGGGCLLALACFAAWEKPGALVSSRLGIAMTVLAVLGTMAGIWSDTNNHGFAKGVLAIAAIALASAHASTMWLARLPPRLLGVRTMALATNVLLTVTSIGILWEEPRGDGAFQLVAVLAILCAALTLAVVAISTTSRIGAASQPGAADVCFCPRCGKSLWEPAGEIRCRHCDERFFVELRKVDDLPGAVLQR
jgi:DNA-directed RNA polymerase subunit RPC12/RpoP